MYYTIHNIYLVYELLSHNYLQGRKYHPCIFLVDKINFGESDLIDWDTYKLPSLAILISNAIPLSINK